MTTAAMPGVRCYHGHRLRYPRGDVAGVVVVAHDPRTEWRGNLIHFPRHTSTGAGFDWGRTGAGAADLARCLLLDAIGSAAVCPDCGGRERLVWLGPDVDDGPEPYDEARHADVDPELITACICGDGMRMLPYRALELEMVARWRGDSWRVTRADLLAWLVGQYEKTPRWLDDVARITTVDLPP